MEVFSPNYRYGFEGFVTMIIRSLKKWIVICAIAFGALVVAASADRVAQAASDEPERRVALVILISGSNPWSAIATCLCIGANRIA
jgi:hypothetical protein